MSSKSSLSSSSSRANATTATNSVAVHWKENLKQQSSSLSLSSSSSSSLSDLTVSNVPSLIEVKKEPPEDEIKEYAADAMSELLGWYGYEKVDIRCTRGLNLDHFASSTGPKHNRNLHHHHHQQQQQQQQQSQHQSCTIGSGFINNRNSPGVHQQTRASRSPQSRTSHSSSTSSISVVSNKESDVAPVSPPLSLRTAPASPRVLEHSDTASDTPDSSTTCSWCGRAGGTWEPGSGTLSCGINNNSGRFCSEACFAAGRRAAFKRARTCDWCRHVRHSVSYVDFQDGESQLQFCSDKCLNQYKMNIFCRETQAHLALHGLASLSSNNPNTSGGLITPELWLRDCRSPPPPSLTEDEALVVDDEPTIWPTECSESRNQVNQISRDDEKLLSVETTSTAPPQTHDFDDTSNDIFNEETEEAIRESLKEAEERKIQKCQAEMNSLKSLHSRVESNPSIASRRSRSSPENSKESPSECTREGTIYLKDVRQLLGKDIVGKMRQQTSSNRSRKVSKSPTWHVEHEANDQTPPRGIGVHQPFSPHPIPMKFTPRPGNFPRSSPMTMGPPSMHSLHPNGLLTNPQAGLLPPVTILVPYPIPIPIPLPIPIPIPLFGKFFNTNMYNSCETKRQENTSSTNTATDANVEIPIVPEDLSQRGQTKNIPKRNHTTNIVDKAAIPSDSSSSSSPALSSTTSCAPFSTTHTTDSLPVLPITSTNINGRPLRKRRRQSTATDQIDMRLKRRSKFVPV